MDGLHIRLATLNDASGILNIYSKIVENTTTSFEITVPTIDEMKSRIRQKIDDDLYPWIVCVAEEGEIIGYAYATKWRTRAAYNWTAELAIYVSDKRRRKGVGSSLYKKLFEILKLQGFQECVAGVTLPNDQSCLFHESHGFVNMGTKKRAGFKHGKWCDVRFYEKSLSNDNDPPPLKKVKEVA